MTWLLFRIVRVGEGRNSITLLRCLLPQIFLLLFVHALFAQPGETTVVGESVASGLFTKLYLEKVTVSPVAIVCHFYFYNSNVWSENVVLTAAYCDDFVPTQISGIALGQSASIAAASRKTFSVSVQRPAGVLYLSGMLSTQQFSTKIKLAKEFKEWSNEDISSLVARVPFQKSTGITKNQKRDDQPPRISITSPKLVGGVFRTDEYIVSIEGKAGDNSGLAEVLMNNKRVSLKSDGSFESQVRLKLGSNPFKVQAKDLEGNSSDLSFSIVREEYSAEDEFPDVDIAIRSGRKYKDGIAVIFGVEEYQSLPSVRFAQNDAEIFREYLVHTFGFSKENIYLKTNERVTRGEFEKVFSENGWLSRRTDQNSDVYVYYAGHGAPDLKEKLPYLIPYDGDANYPTQTGFSLARLYEHLANLNARSVTVFLDACFSGATRDNKMLLADARPVAITIENPVLLSEKMVVFTASSGDQISSAYPEKKHGLFTYFLLKGIRGDADMNKDKNITASELEGYLVENVNRTAGQLDREQTPQVMGSEKRNRVLVKY